MARRTASRADRLQRALALLLGVICVLAGCGEEPADRTLTPPSEMVDGYAYTAMLISRHPLWGALRDLEAAVDDLGDDDWDPVIAPIDDRFDDLVFIESYALSDPRPRMAALREGWRRDYPDLLLPTQGLAEDLQARVDWEAEQAERRIRRRMAEAESAQSRYLAQLRARLVEQYQERLTNLSIEATLRQDEAGAANRERERVLAAIDAEIEAASAACDEQLTELRAALEQRRDEQVAAARERAERIKAQREATMLQAGEQLHDAMAAQMEEPWPRASTEDGSVSAQMRAEPANRRLEEIGLSREAAEVARREKAVRQRERMQASLGRLRAKIKAGTETAAKVVAYRNGIRLQTLPGGRRQGRDVTDIVADELEEFWTTGGGQRS